MKIYDMPSLPNPARIRIALAEKNATDKIIFISVDVLGGEHRTEAFVKKNPDATVPYLELDDGTVISHCTAITEYIDGTFAGLSLCGTTPLERANIHMMNRRAEDGLLDAVVAYFHHATPGLGPVLETNQLPEWGHRQHSRAQASMRYLDSVLASNAYLAGDAFSMADITAFAGLACADFANVEIPADLKYLAAWRARVGTRPSCAR
jgi:glutathione S-transferase